MANSAITVRDFRKEIPGSLSDLKTWRFPVIESTNANKKVTFWEIRVKLFRISLAPTINDPPEESFIDIEDTFFDSKPIEDAAAWIKIDSGIVGGKTKISSPTIVRVGKNIGKKSATNVWTQALRDAYGTWNKQMKKSATVRKQSDVELLPPMLSQSFNDQKTLPVIDSEHPVYVQRKYNGVRTIAAFDIVTDSVVMYSRRKNLYPGLAYLKAELKEPMKNYWTTGRKIYLDGEIYKHGVALQDISGATRRENNENVGYDFMVYDCFVPSSPDSIYSERKKMLEEFFRTLVAEHVKPVETFTAYSKEDIDLLYNKFLEEEFEGAMVRFDKKYQYSFNERHSKFLLKIKPSFDHEYEITGYTTGEKGKASEALMIICKTPEGKIFPVTPAMEISERVALAKKMSEVEANQKTHFENQWLGKFVIITFDEKSKDGVPQRARTKLEIRTWD